MSAQSYEIENRHGATHGAQAIEPYRNPSYPQRDHFSERKTLEEALRESEARVDAARRHLEGSGGSTGTPEVLRIYHQLLGVRDQIAECCRRVPLEAGELYEEDKERFAHAIAAQERVWQRWGKAVG